MKLVKQPFFLIGMGAIVCAIAIALVGTLMNPSNSLVNKFEKAWNEDDEDLLEECFSPELDEEEIGFASMEFLSVETMLALLEADEDEIEYQILVGEEEEVTVEKENVESTEEDGESKEELTIKVVPTIVVIREDGDVIYVYSSERQIIEIDGEEYFYTGYED